MKKLYLPFEHRYRDDVERIHKILLDRGYDSTLEDCARLWDEYSDSMAAGWMILPDTDEEVFDQIRLEVEDHSH